MNVQFFMALGVSAMITFFLRGLPFIFFTRRDMPAWLKNLGESLPSAVMACLIVYCLQDTRFDTGIRGIAGIIAALSAWGVYAVSKSMFMGMLLATVLYMALLAFL